MFSVLFFFHAFNLLSLTQKKKAMENEKILKKLDRLEKLLSLSTKEILTAEEAELYSGYTLSYIYKLTHARKIPYSKPNNGAVFFKKSDIDNYRLKNYNKSVDQLENEALNYINSRKK
jgi:predicted DNA-binding transcriptional regulator AlpA